MTATKTTGLPQVALALGLSLAAVVAAVLPQLSANVVSTVLSVPPSPQAASILTAPLAAASFALSLVTVRSNPTSRRIAIVAVVLSSVALVLAGLWLVLAVMQGFLSRA